MKELSKSQNELAVITGGLIGDFIVIPLMLIFVLRYFGANISYTWSDYGVIIVCMLIYNFFKNSFIYRLKNKVNKYY